MKTTIEIPDELLRKTKAIAAARGETLHEFISEALTTRLGSADQTTPPSGWRSVFGLAELKMVQEIDGFLETEVERVDASEWR